MKDIHETVYNKLLTIQVKYPRYFEQSNIHIFGCVLINWEEPVTVKVIAKNLPAQIKEDIEKMFPPQEG